MDSRITPYNLLASRGKIQNIIPVTVFGLTSIVSVGVVNDIWPISGIKVWEQTPSTLTIVSDDAGDTNGGVGANRITVVGLDANWETITEEINMNGLTPIVTTKEYIRHRETAVILSGVYGGTTSGGNVGNITITNTVSGEPEGLITSFSGVPLGRTVGGHFTIPEGFVGSLTGLTASVDATKPATLFLMARENAEDFVAPYSGITSSAVLESFTGIQGFVPQVPPEIKAKTDVWFACNPTANNTVVSVFASLLLEKL